MSVQICSTVDFTTSNTAPVIEIYFLKKIFFYFFFFFWGGGGGGGGGWLVKLNYNIMWAISALSVHCVNCYLFQC